MVSTRERLKAVLRSHPLRHQIQGVRFLERLRGRGIIADDMGLGKTYQTIGYIALHPECLPAVIVCPASLKLQWQRELKVHAGVDSTVLDGFKRYGITADIWKKKKGRGECRRSERWFNSRERRRQFISDNWHRIAVVEKMKRPFPPVGRINVINYDVLDDWVEHLLNVLKIKLLVLDECQMIMHAHSRRSQRCRTLSVGCEQIVGLSGTPIMNRPIEFFPVLNMVAPDRFASRTEYAFRFCAPKRGWKGRGWDFSGASNLGELHELVAPIMIRRMKTDVLKDLPKKRRSVIPVSIDNPQEYKKARNEFVEWLLAKKGPDAVKRAKGAIALVKLGCLKRVAAEGMLSTINQWITDFLASTGEKLVVFGEHKAIVDSIAAAHPGACPVQIDGRVQPHKRQAVIDRFQTDPKCRLFVGTIKAAGTGSTLTESSTVAFAELSWVPASHDQAEDRVLRIGQKADKMNAYYFVAQNTYLEKQMELLEEKRGVINKVLDGDADRSVITQVMDVLVADYKKEKQ